GLPKAQTSRTAVRVSVRAAGTMRSDSLGRARAKQPAPAMPSAQAQAQETASSGRKNAARNKEPASTDQEPRNCRHRIAIAVLSKSRVVASCIMHGKISGTL